MKANPLRPARLAPGSAAALLALAGCSAPQNMAPPLAAPRPVSTAPSPRSPAAPVDWHDAALSPGEWSWAGSATGSTASYGEAGRAPLVQIYCSRGAVAVFVPGNPAGGNGGKALMTISTATTTRNLTAQAGSGGHVVSLGARDPLLDAMAFSRGRLAVEVAGQPALVLPADPAIGRVVEDCRKPG